MSDYIIIGAGLAGCVIAERIANILDKKVLIIEKRNHIGGNCFDFYNKDGILIHKYGPHIFHTDMKDVWDYLSNFTEWDDYEHEVLGFIDGKKVPIPFNLNSLYSLLPKSQAENLEKKLVTRFGLNVKIPILELKSVDDKELKDLADLIYKKIYLNYTSKQWGLSPEKLDPQVTGRVPVHISKDNRYFQDYYQSMPKDGFTKLIENMINNPNIEVILDTDFKEIIEIDHQKRDLYTNGEKFNGKLIYTGKIDELFNYKFGELPYRSLKFKFETLNQRYFQEVGTINYPNDHDFTRITEFKHITGQRDIKTTIVKEYPQKYEKDIKGKDIPYYPIPMKENDDLYKKYRRKAQDFENIIFLGRLGEYKYYSMNDTIIKALKVFKEKIANEFSLCNSNNI